MASKRETDGRNRADHPVEANRVNYQLCVRLREIPHRPAGMCQIPLETG